MCGHNWIKHNDIYVCSRCGLTRTSDGKIIFDRKFPGYKNKKRKNK